MHVLNNMALFHFACLFLKKNPSFALLYSLSVDFTSKSFSMDMEAYAESEFCHVVFLEKPALKMVGKVYLQPNLSLVLQPLCFNKANIFDKMLAFRL